MNRKMVICIEPDDEIEVLEYFWHAVNYKNSLN